MAEFTLLLTDEQLEKLLVEDLGKAEDDNTRPVANDIRNMVLTKVLPQIEDKLNDYSDNRRGRNRRGRSRG